MARAACQSRPIGGGRHNSRPAHWHPIVELRHDQMPAGCGATDAIAHPPCSKCITKTYLTRPAGLPRRRVRKSPANPGWRQMLWDAHYVRFEIPWCRHCVGSVSGRSRRDLLLCLIGMALSARRLAIREGDAGPEAARRRRDRKRAAVGKCEGRKSWAEINPELVASAKRLRRRSPKGHRRSLRDVAAELYRLGFVNERGAVFSASSVQSMLE